MFGQKYRDEIIKNQILEEELESRNEMFNKMLESLSSENEKLLNKIKHLENKLVHFENLCQENRQLKKTMDRVILHLQKYTEPNKNKDIEIYTHDQ